MANLDPIFLANCRQEATDTNAANTNLDGSGTINVIWTAGANAGLITRLTIKAAGTTTAGMVRLFITHNSTWHLYKEYPVDAITPSGTVPSFTTNVTFGDGLNIDPSQQVGVTTENEEPFVFTVEGGDY